jgi:hypothetical protein
MGLPENEDQYKIPLLAKLLHSLPHYNITFHRTNNTFRPKNEVYLEVIIEIIDFFLLLFVLHFTYNTFFINLTIFFSFFFLRV